MTNRLQKIALAVGSLPAAATLLSVPAFAVALTTTQVNPGRGFATDFGALLNSVISFVMVIAALIVLLYLILGGIEWITSGGDKGKTESARNKITAAVIGLIILAAAFAILQIVLKALGFNGLNDLLNTGITPINSGTTGTLQ